MTAALALAPEVPRFHVHRAYRLALPPGVRMRLLGFLSVLAEYLDADDRVSESRAELAAATGASERSIQTWERELIALRILKVVGYRCRRRILQMLPPPPPSIYRKSRPRNSHKTGRGTANSGGGRPDQGAVGVPEGEKEAVRKGGGDGSPPSQPPGPGARIYAQYVRAHLEDDPLVEARLEDLAGLYGERGVTIWVRECISYAAKNHRSEAGAAPLLRKKLLEDDVPSHRQNIPDPVIETRRAAVERVADRPGAKGCKHCGTGYGRVPVPDGEEPPPGAVFFMRNPFSQTDIYTCACVAHSTTRGTASPRGSRPQPMDPSLSPGSLTKEE